MSAPRTAEPGVEHPAAGGSRVAVAEPTGGDPAERPSGARTEAILRSFHEESAFGDAYDARLLARLWPFARPHARLFLVSIGLGVLTAGASVVRPYLMQRTLDEGAVAGDARVLLWGVLAFASVVVVEQALGFVQVYTMQLAGVRSMTDLRRSVFAFLHRLRLGYFDRQPVGRLVTRVTNDVDAILELFSSGALNAIVDLVKLIGIVTVMLTLDWRLSLVAFAATPIVGLIVAWVRRRSREAFRAIRAKTARMNANMNEQINGLLVVQAFGREDAAAREFDEINRAYRDANLQSIQYDATQDAAIEMVTAICLASVIYFTGFHSVSFGTLVAFNAYLMMFFEPISALAQRYTLLQSAMTGAERIFGLLDLRGEADAPEATESAAAGTGSTALGSTAVGSPALGSTAVGSTALGSPAVGSPALGSTAPAPAGAGLGASGAPELAFEHVEFSYKPAVPVLRDVTFEVPRGQRVALVGPTGAGKTTVTALLSRLYEVQAGVVRVAGRDVRSMTRRELRRHFAVVTQDMVLFPGSVLDNIALGESEPDLRRAEDALRRMGVLDLFTRRPGGLAAKVDELGSNFSAGERQLIAFARALYRDAPVVVLDEATASIDSETEARVQAALEELLRGRTALIVAHRLSTIRFADRILVFQRGRLVEDGSHEQLVQRDGLYARLHALHYARAETEQQHAGSPLGS